ncbi:hypothetical protein BH23VER1_BH23VER1_14790 [soil metagenome]
MRAVTLATAAPTLVPLQAGSLSAVFDRGTGALRHLRWDGQEILRGIYGAVRDRDWNTVTPEITNLTFDNGSDAFRIAFTAVCASPQRGIDFRWQGEITASAAGAVTYTFSGAAHSAFLRNRIGLCALHPAPGTPGHPCLITHVDGTTGPGRFPESVSPHQPFQNLRALTHQPVPGLHVRVEFEGDTFETEDQRNWTDASFKTYSTPLDLPFPVPISAGDTVAQSITLTVTAPPPTTTKTPARPSAPDLQFDWASPLTRPPVGFGFDPSAPTPSAATLDALKTLAPDHLRIDLHPAEPTWRDALTRSATVAAGVPCALHLALHLDPASARSQLESVTAALDALPCPVALALVFSADHPATPPALADLARDLLPAGLAIAAGTDAHFAELNRNRLPAGRGVHPTFSITPQAHAFDDLSLVESLEAQPATVATARTFSPHPAVVSPITLLPRWNPNATSGETAAGPDADPRQAAPFNAAWTLGSLANLLTAPGLHSLTYFETHGPRGLMGTDGSPFPVASAFAALAGSTHVFPTKCSDPLATTALALAFPDGTRKVFAASFLTGPLPVTIDGQEATLDPRSIAIFDPAPGTLPVSNP